MDNNLTEPVVAFLQTRTCKTPMHNTRHQMLVPEVKWQITSRNLLIRDNIRTKAMPITPTSRCRVMLNKTRGPHSRTSHHSSSTSSSRHSPSNNSSPNIKPLIQIKINLVVNRQAMVRGRCRDIILQRQEDKVLITIWLIKILLNSISSNSSSSSNMPLTRCNSSDISSKLMAISISQITITMLTRGHLWLNSNQHSVLQTRARMVICSQILHSRKHSKICCQINNSTCKIKGSSNLVFSLKGSNNIVCSHKGINNLALSHKDSNNRICSHKGSSHRTCSHKDSSHQA